MRRSDLFASLIGRLGSSAFRLSTTTVSISLAGSCSSLESAPKRSNAPHPSSRDGHIGRLSLPAARASHTLAHSTHDFFLM
jgi:hypothetical protein